jgi:chromosome segregation ATPase
VIGTPVGDSIVPGGASNAPDTETLKKYLMLREQDVSVLSSQLRTAQEQIRSLEGALREERSKSSHLAQIKEEQDRKIDGFERDKASAMESLQSEIAELSFQLKARSDKAKAMEYQVRDAATEMERLKERVRIDIRKIRVREKELENRLEIVKKDGEALIGARETKIIELKRKLDILEFNLDLLQNQYNREKENSARLRERLVKAAQVVKVAGGLLQPSGSDGDSAASASGSKVKSDEASDREAS